MERPLGMREPVQNTDDARAIRRAARGDVDAFEELYHAHIGRVYALCLRLSGDPDRAEDLAQDVFVRLWQRIDTFEGRSAFSSWLYRLTANLVIDRLRAHLRRESRESSADDLDRWTGPAAGAPDAWIDLEASIAALPAGARMVFVLHDIEGYRHDEIGEMMGIADGTSKAQLHRARKLLRRSLG